jgi:hypothetical protein
MTSPLKRVRVVDEAYELIALHAAKYPEQPILGYLVGVVSGDQVMIYFQTISSFVPLSFVWFIV